MNAAEQLIEQGRVQGRADGLEQGEVKGLRAAITHVQAARSLALSELERARLSVALSALSALSVRLRSRSSLHDETALAIASSRQRFSV